MSYCLIKNKNNIPDINGYGSVPYNFLIDQFFISYENYISFLNSIGMSYKSFDLYNNKLKNIINKNRGIFTINSNIDPKLPISHIGITQLKIYCNWLNTQNLKYIFDFPYNLRNNTQNIQDATLWIPSFDEWYKATYFDSALNKYWLFPNKSNQPNDRPSLSPYGLVDAGLVYYTIIDNNKNIYAPENKYLISGGSQNRHPLNAKSGTIYSVSDTYYASYISARLCKKSNTKKFILKLYDTYGDGWGPNYIDIKDSTHNILYNNLSLKDGYGPINISLEVDTIERNIIINYIKIDCLSYENYYELYDAETKALIFASNMYETPPENIIISLS